MACQLKKCTVRYDFSQSAKDNPLSDAAPVPTRREARREERRQIILEVAERTFRELGYAATTMSAIAAELGGSKGTLWSYFASKEALFDAVLDRATTAFREELALDLDPAAPIADNVRRFCERFVKKLTEPVSISLHRLIIGEAGRFPEMGRIFYDRAPRRTHLLIVTYLQRAMDDGTLRRDDPLCAAQYLTALCAGRSHQQLLSVVIDAVSSETVREEAAMAAAMFLRAYAPDAPVADA